MDSGGFSNLMSIDFETQGVLDAANAEAERTRYDGSQPSQSRRRRIIDVEDESDDDAMEDDYEPVKERVSANADGYLNKKRNSRFRLRMIMTKGCHLRRKRERCIRERVIMVAKGSRKKRNKRLLILKTSQVIMITESHRLRNRGDNTHLCGKIL